MTMACPACDVAPLAIEQAEHAQANVILSAPNIHCAACIKKIERTLMALEGVHFARVNLSLKRVSVGTRLHEQDIVAALAKAGFEAHPLSVEVLQQATDRTGRDLLWRLGLAGFAMMNVMLLSVAVWSGAEAATRDLFHLISAAIAFPVVILSGQPFFSSALTALKGRRLNMDVPISLAIFLAVCMSLYETLNSGEHAYFDAALSLTFFLLIGRYLDHRTRANARSAAKELSALEQTKATRVDASGRSIETKIDELEVGDTLLIATGMRLPVDGTLLSDKAQLDRSFLTGESDSMTAVAGDVLRAGEINLGAPFQIIATAVGQDTTLRQISALVETAENARNRYTDLADKAAAIYAPAVHLLAFFAFVGWVMWSGDVRLSLNIAIAVLIITCPCALGLAVPAVSTAAISRLYEKGYLVKTGSALERLAEVDTVVFDKTGTLTLPSIDAVQIPAEDQPIVLALAQTSNHPISQAVVRALKGQLPADIGNVEEIAGCGVQATYAGASIQLGNAAWLGADEGDFGYRIGDRVKTLKKVEQLRPGAAEAVGAVMQAGYEVIMLSGDTKASVQKTADQLEISAIFARAAPEEKYSLLEKMKHRGKHVLMVGDGLNDTPSLAAAHVSLAPASAIDAARTASDLVLMRADMSDLPILLQTGRKARRISVQNFGIALAYNCIAVPIALLGFATPLIAALAMSSSSITVLLNAMRVRRVSP